MFVCVGIQLCGDQSNEARFVYECGSIRKYFVAERNKKDRGQHADTGLRQRYCGKNSGNLFERKGIKSMEKNGQKIYWEIHCFEESIVQFIEQVVN